MKETHTIYFLKNLTDSNSLLIYIAKPAKTKLQENGKKKKLFLDFRLRKKYFEQCVIFSFKFNNVFTFFSGLKF